MFEIDGSETAGLETAGLETAGLETAGLEAAGLEAAGLETAGPETAAIDAPVSTPPGLVLREQVDRLQGPALAALLAGLGPAAHMDGWTLLESLRGWEKVKRSSDAQQLRAVAELARRRPDVQAGWMRDVEPARGRFGLLQRTADADVGGELFEQVSAEVALALEIPLCHG